MSTMILSVVIIVSSMCWNAVNSANRPNIIYIMADDLGWNDLSFHGSPQIPTPNLDALASASLILHNYYAQPLCTPSRSSLLTGRYPIRHGLQHDVILAGVPSGLPLNATTMPQHLKNLGYSTHLVGKWHLGYFKKDYTPTYRGFDTFFGYYNHDIDYYDYTHFFSKNLQETWGVDLHNGTETIMNFRGQYSTDVFTQKGIDIIQHHNKTKPLFLYMSYTAVHTGTLSVEPFQAPFEYVKKHRYIKDMQRRKYAGMVAALDAAVGKIFHALHMQSMLSNTILVFSADNGASCGGFKNGVGSNWPLRGTKYTLWEGGIRVPGFVWSPLLGITEPKVSTQLMHITDWLPTLYVAAGGNVQDLGEIDGYNMWDAWINNSSSPRSIILHNVDPILHMSALRYGDYKLVNGTFPDIITNKWHGPTGQEDIEQPISMDEYVFQNGSIIRDILQESGYWLAKVPDVWRTNLGTRCQQPPKECEICGLTSGLCLFDIVADPCEYNNLAQKFPEVVISMLKRIDEYAAEAVEPQVYSFDPHSDPNCHGFAHVSWMDEEHKSNCLHLE